MLEIRTLADIEGCEARNVIKKPFADYLKAYFEDLRMGLDREKSVQLFSLEEHGHIIVLEQMEDCKSLSQIGVEGVADILKLIPEFVNILELEGTKTYYQAGILCSNEFMLILYIPKGFDDAVEMFLQEYIV